MMRRSVHLTSENRLVVEGHDLGDTEYEFERTLSVAETARLGLAAGGDRDGPAMAELLEVSAASSPLTRRKLCDGSAGLTPSVRDRPGRAPSRFPW